MKKDFYPDRTICNLQLELKNDYKILKNYDADDEIKDLIIKMYNISKSIHYKATRMEKRLLKYRKAIEDLGFERNK